MKFKALTPAEFDAMSEYKKEKYLDEKSQNDAEVNGQAAKKAAEDVVEEAITKAKTELTILIDAAKGETDAVQVKLDAAQVEIDAMKAENNRIRIAAKENEKKGTFFDEALVEAFETDAFKADLKAMRDDKNAKVKVTLKAVGTMGISSIADIEMANAELRPGIAMLPNRRIHMRSIMNTGRMTTSDYHYLREVGGDNDVAAWAENSGQKSQLDLTYIEKVAPSQYIAGYLNISRKSLEDVTALNSALSYRLLEKYLIQEDFQILQGSGISPILQGILGVAQAYNGSETFLVDRILDGCAQLEENEYYADGVLVKPRDWAAVLRTQTTLGYTLPSLGTVVMQNGILYVGGVPVYKMNGMPGNNRQFLAGDWMLGAQLLLRDDPSIVLSYENQDNFIQNIVTVRVEGRSALPIYYPEAFVKGTTNVTT